MQATRIKMANFWIEWVQNRLKYRDNLESAELGKNKNWVNLRDEIFMVGPHVRELFYWRKDEFNPEWMEKSEACQRRQSQSWWCPNN